MEGMHPFGQIMEVLPVPIPFQIFVIRIVRLSFIQFFSYPQTPLGRVQPPFLFRQPADPSGSRIICTISAQYLMNLRDEG
jgi:hypothetical protein